MPSRGRALAEMVTLLVAIGVAAVIVSRLAADSAARVATLARRL